MLRTRADYCRAWYEKNLEKKKAYDRQYYQDNKVKRLQQRRAHYLNNTAYYISNALNRKKRVKEVNDILTEDDKWLFTEMVKLCKLREEATGIKWEIDHIVPVSKGGRHALINLQVVPMLWNRRKLNRNTDKYDSATRRD